MPYIGVSPQFGVRRKHTYTATAGQTSFSGAGSEGATLSYKDSNFVDVYQNGVKLGDADYTSTSGTAIVLGTGATVNDIIEIIVFDAFSAADTVSKADGGTFDNPVTITTADNSVNLNLVSTDADANSGPLLEMKRDSSSPADNDLLGSITFKGENSASEEITYAKIQSKLKDATDGTEDGNISYEIMIDGTSRELLTVTKDSVVVNQDSQDVDFRVESNGNANMLFVDAGNDKIGINTNAPNRMLGIENGDVQIHETGSSDPLLQFSVGNTQASPTQSYSLRIDNSDSDKFQLINGTSGEIALSVDTTGAITKPKQPAFLVTPANNQLDLANHTVFIMDNEIFDQNSDFDTSNYTFTAPVTGRYQLQFVGRFNNIDKAGNWVRVELVTSNRYYQGTLIDPGVFGFDPEYWSTFTIAVLADMDAGDTAFLQWGQSGGAAQADLDTDAQFSGFLVC